MGREWCASVRHLKFQNRLEHFVLPVKKHLGKTLSNQIDKIQI